jgi:Zn-dependent oligopeptidase
MQMATPEMAMALLEELRNASYATAWKELDDLRKFAAKQVSPVALSCTLHFQAYKAIFCQQPHYA